MTTPYSELQAKTSGVFHGYDFGYGFGMAYPGYVPPSYSEYPNGYMPGACQLLLALHWLTLEPDIAALTGPIESNLTLAGGAPLADAVCRRPPIPWHRCPVLY
jgi:hypothetical protein